MVMAVSLTRLSINNENLSINGLKLRTACADNVFFCLVFRNTDTVKNPIVRNMPIKYIGKTTDFKGKSLWQILGNLKNYGVGRMVIRNRFDKYPEPCYMRILKVAALPMIGESSPDNTRKVVALVEKTFRGRKDANPVQIDSVSYKADFRLIPKDQEWRYSNVICEQPVNILPRERDFPPLLKEILIHRAKQTGCCETEKVKLKIRYNLKSRKRYRIAEEHETPTKDFEANSRSTLYMTTDDKHENAL